MDAGTIHVSDSWLMRLGEHTVRSVAMALVLTGQMLPAGSVSAQEEPPAPSFVSPEPPLTPVSVTPDSAIEVPVAETKSEDAAPADAATESKPEDMPPVEPAAPVPTPADIPVDEKAIHDVADEVKAAAEAAVKAAKKEVAEPVDQGGEKKTLAPEPSTLIAPPPVVISAETQAEVASTESHYTFGDWTVTVRPGIIPAKPDPFIQEPIQQTSGSLSVPVNVHINNVSGTQMPLQWYTPSTYPSWGLTPSSAYLFQRPLPFWKTRGDFDQLAPFIPGFRYW